jgi:hypothetical protein
MYTVPQTHKRYLGSITAISIVTFSTAAHTTATLTTAAISIEFYIAAHGEQGGYQLLVCAQKQCDHDEDVSLYIGAEL